MTIQYTAALKFASDIKKKIDIPIIIGGFHISSLPGLLSNSYDIGVIGEGEQTMLELVKLFSKKDWKKYLHNIKGIVFRDGKKLIQTPLRELIDPLDKIPFPDRDLLDMGRYLNRSNVFGPKLGRGTSMFSSRGCPYRCVFCSASAFWGNIRYFSPAHVVKEIELLIEKYKVELIHIYDDLFIANKKRLYDIAELVNKRKINKKVEFGICARADLLDEEICQILKKMNVVALDFGMESGSPRILSFLKNNTVTIQDIRSAVKLARRYGFIIAGSFIIGSPGETREDMLKTLHFLKSLKLDKFAFFIATPYPNTKLWKIAQEQGIIDDNINNINWDMLDIKRLNGQLGEEDILTEKQVLLSQEISAQQFIEIYRLFEQERRRLFNYQWHKDENYGQ